MSAAAGQYGPALAPVGWEECVGEGISARGRAKNRIGDVGSGFGVGELPLETADVDG